MRLENSVIIMILEIKMMLKECFLVLILLVLKKMLYLCKANKVSL